MSRSQYDLDWLQLVFYAYTYYTVNDAKPESTPLFDKIHFQMVDPLPLSPPIPLRLYTLPYWSNPPFLISDIRALWRSVLSARVPECQKLKTVGQTSMALNPSNSSNLENLALKGLIL